MQPDIAIVGGGVVGCAIAYALARAGAGRIVVVDRGAIGAEASGAAAGVLAVGGTRAPGGALFELRRASLALLPTLADDLREQTGIDAAYRQSGLLELAFDDAEAATLAALVAQREAQGLTATLLDPAAVRTLEPSVSASVRGGALFAGDGMINSGRFVEALHAAATVRGVEFRTGAALTAIDVDADRARSIVVGGERLAPGHLILAAGAWSSDVGALLGVKIPVRPDKGEMVALRLGWPVARPVVWDGGYVVPCDDGDVIVGSTSARGETDKSVQAKSLLRLLERALLMVPALRDAGLVRTWAGLRPCSTIRRPIIAPLPTCRNVIVATGHHRSGILLAPITAELVAALLLQTAPGIDLQPFGYRPR